MRRAPWSVRDQDASGPRSFRIGVVRTFSTWRSSKGLRPRCRAAGLMAGAVEMAVTRQPARIDGALRSPRAFVASRAWFLLVGTHASRSQESHPSHLLRLSRRVVQAWCGVSRQTACLYKIGAPSRLRQAFDCLCCIGTAEYWGPAGRAGRFARTNWSTLTATTTGC